MIRVVTKSCATASNLSNEDVAAEQLKQCLSRDLANYLEAKGTIYIMTSIRLFGQKRNDIDMIVMGFLDGFCIKNVKTKNQGNVGELAVKSFICNIELKSHSANGVKHEGTDYIVSYKGIPHNASQQCVEAKFSLINHLKDQLYLTPFICDILWLNGLSMTDLARMRGNTLDNALPRGFTVRDFFNVILQQADVMRDQAGRYFLDCFKNGEKEYQSIVALFTMERKPQGLTKQKFEQLSQNKAAVDALLQDAGQKLTIVTGRAGTGKTVQLLQLAFRLADETNLNRCLILTYNQALVSDIRRLIDFTPMPTKVDGRTVSIQTIHSFFHTVMKESGMKTDHLNPQKKTYETDYAQALEELYHYVVEQCSKEDVSALKDMAQPTIDWDYILIDEAQDFTDLEKQILFKIYGASRLIVADGVDQFMRTGQRQIWEKDIDKCYLRKPKTMDLERRQKANLVTFVNEFAKLANLDWKVRPNDDLPGGEIKIYPKFKVEHFKMLKENCDRNHCENYDILILEPPTQVVTDGQGNRFFAKAEKYASKNIPIFDGINNRNRTTYPTKDQCRVYQYDSCRGLEGWCVVCADFDELIKYKFDTFKEREDELGLDQEEAKRRHVLLWALMPLTRPIDTLVITLSDAESMIGTMLKTLADAFPDFIEWNIK